MHGLMSKRKCGLVTYLFRRKPSFSRDESALFSGPRNIANVLNQRTYRTSPWLKKDKKANGGSNSTLVSRNKKGKVTYKINRQVLPRLQEKKAGGEALAAMKNYAVKISEALHPPQQKMQMPSSIDRQAIQKQIDNSLFLPQFKDTSLPNVSPSTKKPVLKEIVRSRSVEIRKICESASGKVSESARPSGIKEANTFNLEFADTMQKKSIPLNATKSVPQVQGMSSRKSAKIAKVDREGVKLLPKRIKFSSKEMLFPLEAKSASRFHLGNNRLNLRSNGDNVPLNPTKVSSRNEHSGGSKPAKIEGGPPKVGCVPKEGQVIQTVESVCESGVKVFLKNENKKKSPNFPQAVQMLMERSKSCSKALDGLSLMDVLPVTRGMSERALDPLKLLEGRGMTTGGARPPGLMQRKEKSGQPVPKPPVEGQHKPSAHPTPAPLARTRHKEAHCAGAPSSMPQLEATDPAIEPTVKTQRKVKAAHPIKVDSQHDIKNGKVPLLVHTLQTSDTVTIHKHPGLKRSKKTSLTNLDKQVVEENGKIITRVSVRRIGRAKSFEQSVQEPSGAGTLRSIDVLLNQQCSLEKENRTKEEQQLSVSFADRATNRKAVNEERPLPWKTETHDNVVYRQDEEPKASVRALPAQIKSAQIPRGLGEMSADAAVAVKAETKASDYIEKELTKNVKLGSLSTSGGAKPQSKLPSTFHLHDVLPRSEKVQVKAPSDVIAESVSSMKSPPPHSNVPVNLSEKTQKCASTLKGFKDELKEKLHALTSMIASLKAEQPSNVFSKVSESRTSPSVERKVTKMVFAPQNAVRHDLPGKFIKEEALYGIRNETNRAAAGEPKTVAIETPTSMAVKNSISVHSMLAAVGTGSSGPQQSEGARGLSSAGSSQYGAGFSSNVQSSSPPVFPSSESGSHSVCESTFSCPTTKACFPPPCSRSSECFSSSTAQQSQPTGSPRCYPEAKPIFPPPYNSCESPSGGSFVNPCSSKAEVSPSCNLCESSGNSPPEDCQPVCKPSFPPPCSTDSNRLPEPCCTPPSEPCCPPPSTCQPGCELPYKSKSHSIKDVSELPRPPIPIHISCTPKTKPPFPPECCQQVDGIAGNGDCCKKTSYVEWLRQSAYFITIKLFLSELISNLIALVKAKMCSFHEMRNKKRRCVKSFPADPRTSCNVAQSSIFRTKSVISEVDGKFGRTNSFKKLCPPQNKTFKGKANFRRQIRFVKSVKRSVHDEQCRRAVQAEEEKRKTLGTRAPPPALAYSEVLNIVFNQKK